VIKLLKNVDNRKVGLEAAIL